MFNYVNTSRSGRQNVQKLRNLNIVLVSRCNYAHKCAEACWTAKVHGCELSRFPFVVNNIVRKNLVDGEKLGSELVVMMNVIINNP